MINNYSIVGLGYSIVHYGLAVASPYREWPENKTVAPFNVLAFSQRYHSRGTNAGI